jgi:hypothetical protein
MRKLVENNTYYTYGYKYYYDNEDCYYDKIKSITGSYLETKQDIEMKKSFSNMLY